MKPLGSSGINASTIGLGAWVLGGGQVWGKDTDDRESIRTIHAALDHGINLIDTAPAYGLSEARLGAALGSRRDGIFLSSKVGEVFERGSSTYDFTERACAESLTRSLDKLLRTDWIWCGCTPTVTTRPSCAKAARCAHLRTPRPMAASARSGSRRNRRPARWPRSSNPLWMR